MGAEEADGELAALIAGLDADAVVDLLTRASRDHDDVARAVRLAASSDAERLRLLRDTVDRGLRTRRFLDYWASSRWAAEAAPIVDALGVEAARRPTRELVTLLERAIGHVVKVVMNADDSNGQIGLLARDLLELHVGVCDGGVADQVALAKWMVRFTFEDQDFFVVDPVRYAVALGEEGLSVYRAEVTRRAIGVGDRERSFAERYSRQRLAIIDRDVPALIEELGGDLSSPHQFSRVVEAMLELDDPDAALEWAQRGIAETDGWQVAKLYDLAASILSDRGEDDGVFRLRLQHHQRMPSGSTYRSLRTAAEVTGRWSDVRSDARELLEARSPGDYIDALLADHDTAEAWTAAMSNAAWQLDDRQWERLAAERESDDPAAAFDVYLRLADSALQAANRNAYRTAVRHLQAAGRCASRANLDAALHQHMVNLRNVHRRRPTFIAMLDKAKLP